jgi:uncharacterized protein (TIGR03790 family)
MDQPMRSLVLAALAALGIAGARNASALSADELAVVINDADALSQQIGAYYARVRQIPARNVLHVRIPVMSADIGTEAFAKLKVELDAQTPTAVQAYALAWLAPYRVGCMSITSAFAFGFDRAHCATGCAMTKYSPYYNSTSTMPFTDYGIRPAMNLAARDLYNARALIDRGLAASKRAAPIGRAYLVSTSDAARNVRAAGYDNAVMLVGKRAPVEIVKSDGLKGRNDVLFYFTGIVNVPDLTTNRFVPGAVGDHLTSAGGDLLGRGQMSAVRWLEAGATASYGTVVEPCNFTAKFPNPGLMMRWYLAGETLIEAYWKSVAMPGQGVFIGDPLARIH